MTYTLTNPPNTERERELWLQHAAGFVLFQDMKQYAIGQIPPDTDDETKGKIVTGINDTLYGLMMIMDGVSGCLSNNEYEVTIKSIITLKNKEEVVQEIDTFYGDGMCMGFHSWNEGDFGEGQICPVHVQLDEHT